MWRMSPQRFDMQGMVGVDGATTRRLLVSGVLSAFEQGLLRSLLLGAAITPARLLAMKRINIEEATCSRCTLDEANSVGHWWHCPSFRGKRLALELDFDEHLWPRGLTRCGLAPAYRPVHYNQKEWNKLIGNVQRFLLHCMQTQYQDWIPLFKKAFGKNNMQAAGGEVQADIPHDAHQAEHAHDDAVDPGGNASNHHTEQGDEIETDNIDLYTNLYEYEQETYLDGDGFEEHGDGDSYGYMDLHGVRDLDLAHYDHDHDIDGFDAEQFCNKYQQRQHRQHSCGSSYQLQ
jgi:hypothetical protein